MMNWWIAVFLSLSFSAYADPSIQVEEQIERVRILLGVEGSQSSSTLSSMTAVGPHAHISYGLADKHAAGLAITQTYETDSMSALYFDVAGFYEYAVRGSYLSKTYKLKQDSKEISREQSPQKSITSLGIGLDQMFLNGKNNIYSGTGVTFKAAHDFRLSSIPLNVGLRYSALTVKGESFSVFSFTLSYLY